jgi:hypothetical protein
MIQLTTPRLLIRDHKPEDLQTHHELFSDRKIMWFLQDIRTKNLEDSRKISSKPLIRSMLHSVSYIFSE